jgi:hypothetical protein
LPFNLYHLYCPIIFYLIESSLRLLNHALALCSPAQAMPDLWLAAWRSLPGTILLYGAAIVHSAMALRAIALRRNWRLPPGIFAWQTRSAARTRCRLCTRLPRPRAPKLIGKCSSCVARGNDLHLARRARYCVQRLAEPLAGAGISRRTEVFSFNPHMELI